MVKRRELEHVLLHFGAGEYTQVLDITVCGGIGCWVIYNLVPPVGGFWFSTDTVWHFWDNTVEELYHCQEEGNKRDVVVASDGQQLMLFGRRVISLSVCGFEVLAFED